jgi:hypothetical protein
MFNKVSKQLRSLLWSKDSRFVDKLEVQRCCSKNEEEKAKTPKRYDIINYLLGHTENKRYLEIGVRNPADCFDRIIAAEKYSVDPGIECKDNAATFKVTSDEFFELIANQKLDIATQRFGVIFLDGLHLAEQAFRDMVNCISILDSPGFLVVHDCNPPTIHHAREDYRIIGPAGQYWNGTTWKAFARFRSTHTNRAFVIDTDWGVGVVCKHIDDKKPGLSGEWNPFYEYRVFDQNRRDAFNLITFKELSSLI